LACPKGSEAGEFADLVNCHLVRLPRQLAPPFEEPGYQFLAWVRSLGEDAVDEDRGLVACEGYPAEPCDQRLLACAFDAGFKALPSPVRCIDGGPMSGRHLRHGGLVLGCQRLEHRCFGDPTQTRESPNVDGQQVVLDDAPVFGAEGLDDVVVVEILSGRVAFGFAAPHVGGTFRLDHIEWHAQRDQPVDRPAAVGDSAVGLLR
jgi:hypothetical protein